jgi:hypothetical protein
MDRMGITSIRTLRNDSARDVILQNRENGRTFVIPPGGHASMNEWIPWCTRAGDFERRHILITVRQPERYYWIWQHWDRDGDYVRFTHEGRYRSANTPPEYAPARRVEDHLPRIPGRR